jgi:hypothetical protein
MGMTHALFDLKRWDSLEPDERQNIVQEVSRHLPPSFRFRRMATCELGEQKHTVAFYDWKGASFALIPGGRFTLGYDRKKPFQPTEAQRKEWQHTEEEYGVSLEKYLDNYMTPLRKVTILPFLLEVCAEPVGRTPISVFPVAFEEKWLSYRKVQEAVAQEGFRLPTSDEWEYACAAGSRTLFRWGDDCPVNHYPAGERKKHRFNLQRRPNAFGLQIASDPYDWEVCAWPDFLRGGDGGGIICCGAGFLAGWLTLASAYLDRDSIQHYGKDEEIPSLYLRRAYSLPSGLFGKSRTKGHD